MEMKHICILLAAHEGDWGIYPTRLQLASHTYVLRCGHIAICTGQPRLPHVDYANASNQASARSES